MTTRRTAARVEDFARAVDRPGAVAADPAVASLAAVAAGLATIPLRSAPAFKEALRARLMAEAASVLPAGTAGPGAPTPPATPASPGLTAPAAPAPVPAPAGMGTGWLAGPAGQLLTGGLAVSVAVAGSGLAAHRSLPGDPFYGVKRAVERLRFGLAGGAVDEAVALSGEARSRLGEIDAMLPDQAEELSASARRRIEAALQTLDTGLRRAIDRLLRAVAAGDARAYAELLALLASARAGLVPLLPRLPDALRAQVRAVLERVALADGVLAVLPVPPAARRTPAPTESPSPSPSVPVPTGVPTPPPTSVPPVSPSPSPSRTLLPPLPSLPTIELPILGD